MKQHIKSLPHHPKRVIIISLIIALAIGTYGYIKINKTISPVITENKLETNTNISNTLSLGFLSGGRIKSVSVKTGDIVTKGTILATLDSENTLGALTQAKATYKTTQANYQKIINGATGTAIDVAKANVHTIEVNLDGVTKQQNLLVANAYANLLNSTITATISNSDNNITAPTVTGTYIKNIEGSINLTVSQAGTGGYVTFQGIINGTTPISTTAPQALGDSGLYIQFPSINGYAGTVWNINIPNITATNYLANYNAYKIAQENKNQVIENTQAALDQAKASLTALVAAARPEDIAMAQAQMDSALGAVQIAQANYQNTIIVAPTDGIVTSIAITPGQIAIPNAPAIEFTSSNN